MALLLGLVLPAPLTPAGRDWGQARLRREAQGGPVYAGKRPPAGHWLELARAAGEWVVDAYGRLPASASVAIGQAPNGVLLEVLPGNEELGGDGPWAGRPSPMSIIGCASQGADREAKSGGAARVGLTLRRNTSVAAIETHAEPARMNPCRMPLF